MSDIVRALVWRYYSAKQFGAPRVLAIALSDEADDRGGGISQSIAELAKKTEQHERAVRGQLKRLEASGLLQCVERSAGGPGQFNQYRLDLAALISAGNPAYGAGLTLLQEQGLTSPNPASGAGFQLAPYKELKEELPTDVVTSRVGDEAEDRRLAEWMLGKLRELNPKHREPSWSAWCKDIRLMRERDKRTRREIAELFSHANADRRGSGFSWSTVILSPANLRKHWDRLVLERRPVTSAGTGTSDRSCSREIQGVRCSKPGAFWDREGRGFCRDCREAMERERASAQA